MNPLRLNSERVFVLYKGLEEPDRPRYFWKIEIRGLNPRPLTVFVA